MVLTFPSNLHLTLAPAIAILIAFGVGWSGRMAHTRFFGNNGLRVVTIVALIAGIAIGVLLALWITDSPGSKLYLSWGVSCFLAGVVSLALYRGLYVFMRERARSPLVMLVATLGILLAFSALIVIVFEPTPRPLPDPFGNVPLDIAGASIKGFNIFTIAVAVVGFLGLLWLLKMTTFGRKVRAIGDDEEVSKVVGINTTVIIAIVFFIGAVYAALGGLLSGHDTAIQPRMGLLLLLKGMDRVGCRRHRKSLRRDLGRLHLGLVGAVRHLGPRWRMARRRFIRRTDTLPFVLASGHIAEEVGTKR